MNHPPPHIQPRQLIRATLEAPAEFWRGHTHAQEQAAQPEVAANVQALAPSDEIGLKVTDDSGLIPIRNLSARHRRQIAAHLLDLSEADRYLRFGYAATDEQVHKYVDGLNFERDEIYGVFNRRLQLIAQAHLALASDPNNARCAEFGVSVSAQARGKGLGTKLFERALLHARAEHVDLLFIHILSQNTAMLKIARRAGAVVESFGGEVEAHIRLPAQGFSSHMETVVRDAVEDGVGEVDFQLKRSALQFWAFLGAVQDARQGQRKSDQ